MKTAPQGGRKVKTLDGSVAVNQNKCRLIQ